MSRFTNVAAPLVLALAVSGPAMATTQAWWAVDWVGTSPGITYTLQGWNNGNNNVAHIAYAVGRQYVDGIVGVNDFQAEYQPVFCVDLFHYAYDNWTQRYEVDVHTGADGTDGWTTPTGDYDEFRDIAGLGRAAALASAFGTSLLRPGSVLAAGTQADRNDRAVALNVAIWKAAYGWRFNYVGGLSANQLSYFNDYYMPHYDAGHSVNYYTWWDSKAGDLSSEKQDFLRGEVPEPSSLILLGAILTGPALVAIRRRKRS